MDNAPLALARLLGTLHDANGAIAVDGYLKYEWRACLHALLHVRSIVVLLLYLFLCI